MPTTLQRLPIYVEKGVAGGDRFNTNIPTRASSGHEQRTSEWDAALYEGDISYGIRALDDGGVEDLSAIVKMHRRMRGNYGTFPFRDWSDYQVTNGYIGTGDGSNDEFQLVKRYLYDANSNDVDDDAVEFVRTVTLPESGTVRIFVAGVEKTITTHWTVSLTTGLVTFTVGNEPANGERVTATFDFNKHVRFNLPNDHLRITLETSTHGMIPQIPIIEVIGET